MLYDNLDAEIGARICSLKENAGMSVDQLARELDVTPMMIDLIEKGERGVTRVMLLLLKDVFKVSADYLLTGKE